MATPHEVNKRYQTGFWFWDADFQCDTMASASPMLYIGRRGLRDDAGGIRCVLERGADERGMM